MNFFTYYLSQKGSMAVQFLFGWLLVMGFMAIFSALTFTLAVVEISQYMVYASSRQFFLAHQNFGYQKGMARAKYKTLFNNQVLRPLFSSSLFEIASPAQVNVGWRPYPHFNPNSRTNIPYLFVGVWTPFTARILDIHIPLWGKTSSSGSPGAFTTGIGSYLGREPSLQECQNFNKKRWKWIFQRWNPVISPAVSQTQSQQLYERYLDQMLKAGHLSTGGDNGC